jgi:predicted  nucleic acid-binding Zn-ribbon protein
MSLHLQKFVDRVRGHEARGSKDFVMTLAEAKDMHADITRLLLELRDLREQANKPQTEELITVQVGGGSF